MKWFTNKIRTIPKTTDIGIATNKGKLSWIKNEYVRYEPTIIKNACAKSKNRIHP